VSFSLSLSYCDELFVDSLPLNTTIFFIRNFLIFEMTAFFAVLTAVEKDAVYWRNQTKKREDFKENQNL